MGIDKQRGSLSGDAGVDGAGKGGAGKGGSGTRIGAGGKDSSSSVSKRMSSKIGFGGDSPSGGGGG